MALKKYKECGHDVSSKAKICPNCGTPIKERIGCRGLIGTAIIVVVALIAFGKIISEMQSDESNSNNTASYKFASTQAKNESSKPKHEKEIILNASVKFDGEQFIIQNNGYDDWHNVKIEINSKLFSSGYSYKIPSPMKAGQIYTVGAIQFTKSDGERFNPFTHKPKKLFMLGEIRDQVGYYGGGI